MNGPTIRAIDYPADFTRSESLLNWGRMMRGSPESDNVATWIKAVAVFICCQVFVWINQVLPWDGWSLHLHYKEALTNAKEFLKVFAAFVVFPAIWTAVLLRRRRFPISSAPVRRESNGSRS